MKQLSRYVVLLAASVLMGLVVALPASATPSTDVTFYLTQHDDYGTIGWSAHGALEDSGTWAKEMVTFSGGKSPVYAGMISTVETNSAGTGSFRMIFQGLGYNATGVFAGTWEISQGTGIYAKLHGVGTWTEIDVPDPDNWGHLLFTFPCKGEIHTD